MAFLGFRLFRDYPAAVVVDNIKACPVAIRGERSRSFVPHLLLLSLSVLMSLALCELGLRLFLHNPYRHELPVRVVTLRIHHAHTDYIFDRSIIDRIQPTIRFRTDERSYILPSRSFERPDATVAFLGDSTTECFAVQEDLRFPALVSYLLEKRGLKVNTINIARSGNTVQDSINVLLNHVVHDKPDFVVIMHAWNDMGLLKRYMSYSPRMGETQNLFHVSRFLLQKASSNLYLAAILREWLTFGTLTPDAGALSKEIDKDATPIPVDEYEKRIRAFVRLSRAFGIEPVLMTQPSANFRNALTPDWVYGRNQEVLNHITRKVGAEEETVVIDLVQHLIENVEGWNQPMRLFYDGLHVTDHGSEVYAEYIAERLYEELLARRDVRRP